MNKLTFAIILMGLAFESSAHVIEVNNIDHTVYVHPTPTAKISLLDLERDGGILNVFLDYDQAATIEISDVEKKYPGFNIKLLPADANGNFKIQIPEMGYSQEIVERQGQMGPYVNAQFELSASQTNALKKLGASSQNFIRLEASVRIRFQSQSVLEEIHAGPETCLGVQGETVRGLWNSLQIFKRPSFIKLEGTLVRFKEEMLDKCFNIHTSEIDSFSQLMQTTVTRNDDVKEISVVYSEKTAKDDVLTLSPAVQFSVGGSQ